MNERFGIEPTAFESSFELKALLEKFGPATGRYIAPYPDPAWEQQVLSHIRTFAPVAQLRAKQVLAAARERWVVSSDRRVRPFSEAETWVANVTAVQKSRDCFHGVVVTRPGGMHDYNTLDDLELAPTSAETVLAQKEEYVRVAALFLQRAQELHFVDPYFDPLRQQHRPVFEAMLAAACGPARKTITIWTSDSALAERSNDDLLRSLKASARVVGYRRPYQLSLRRYQSVGSKLHVHDRYLLCKVGGIRFEHGFQELSGGKRVKIEPVSPAIHRELWAIHQDGQHDLHVESIDIPLDEAMRR